MNRYCEIILDDVMNAENPVMSKSRRKTPVVKTLLSETKHTKTKFGGMPLLKRQNVRLCENNSDLVETGETRTTKKSKSNILIQDVDSNSGVMRIVSEPQTKIIPGKRKRYDTKVKTIGEKFSKVCCSGSSRTVCSINSDKQITQNRKRKRKSRESCWENKLTGARRVSKRLSNLRMEKQKSLKSLKNSVDVPHASIKSRQPINFSGRGKIKPNKELLGKSPKSRKVPFHRNHTEVQFNFGKLSYTKRLYPKITGRRPATFNVTIKPTSSIQQNPEDRMEEEINDSDIKSFISNYVEDIQDGICNETGVEGLSDLNKDDGEETDKPADQSKFTTEESDVEIMPQGSEVKNLVSDTTEEEFTDDSSIVIIDIESGENVDCGTVEEKTTNDQSSVTGSNDKKEIVKENMNSDIDEDKVTTDLKQDRKEENGSGSKNNGLNTDVSEAGVKPETKSNESTSFVDSNSGSHVTGTNAISN